RSLPAAVPMPHDTQSAIAHDEARVAWPFPEALRVSGGMLAGPRRICVIERAGGEPAHVLLQAFEPERGVLRIRRPGEPRLQEIALEHVRIARLTVPFKVA